MTDGEFTLTQAAALLGITERTLRSHIKEGKVAARKVIGSKGVAVYRVYLPDPTVDQSGEYQEDPRADPVPDPGVEAFIRHITHLEQTVMELSGRVGFYQARVQSLEAEVRLLAAPVPEPAAADQAGEPVTQPTTPTQNGQHSASERPSRLWWRRWLAWAT